jgi:predicted SAM-dependent methyltransferase
MQKNNFCLDNYKGESNLRLRCGHKRLSDFINVDYYTLGSHDVVANLNEPLPFRSNSFDIVYADNVFEHISNLLGLVRECQRIFKSGGYLKGYERNFSNKCTFKFR